MPRPLAIPAGCPPRPVSREGRRVERCPCPTVPGLLDMTRLPPLKSSVASRSGSTSRGSSRTRQPSSCAFSSRSRSPETMSPRAKHAQRFREMVEASRDRLLREETSVPSRIQPVSSDDLSPKSPSFSKTLPPVQGDACVWFSINPRCGQLQLYPRAAADRLEESFFRCRKNVPLGGLGLCRGLENAVVYLDGDAPLQKTRRGARDVRRLEVGRLEDVVSFPSVQVVQEGTEWRISDEVIEGFSETRSFPTDWITDAVAVRKLWEPLPPVRRLADSASECL